ncbi:MAG: hypothetical protein ACYTAN_09760 [Planctomycetota bacterium]|jgi:hypothetical protein
MRLIQTPAQGARQLGAMSLAEASRLSNRGFSLRMARLQELKKNQARLLRIMARLRENHERKKAAERGEPAFGGWGAPAGAVAGTVLGIPGGPPGMIAGAQMGSRIGGGVEQGASGDLRAGTINTAEGFAVGLEELELFEHEFFSGGGTSVPKAPFPAG